MKQNKLFSLVLAAALSVQLLALPAFAETEPSNAPSESVSAPSGAAEESVPAESVPAGLPVLPETPQAFPLTEDASISHGSATIRGMVPAAAADPQAPVIDAKAALLYDLNSDTIVYALNADEKRYPASLTKIMTCMVALEHITDLDEILTVPQELVDRVDPFGSSMDLVGGEEISMMDLLYGLMVHSANDAAMLIAEHVAGSEEAFVQLMNEKAQELECDQTHFANVHGLHDENHYTTARDMARIMRAAIENETFRELYSTDGYEVPATNKSEKRLMVNTNYMISQAVMQVYYDPRVIGGKTGFTTPAGRCLVTVSQDGSTGMKLLCVIMGAQASAGEEGGNSYAHFDVTRKLLDYGYSTFRPAEVLSDAQTLGRFEVEGGDALAQGRVHGSRSTVLPEGSTIDSITYEYLLRDGTLKAPLEKEQPIGVARVWYKGLCLAQEDLYSASHIKKNVPIADIPDLDPASPVEPQSDVWHMVLLAILALLAVIFLILLYGNIRRAILRSRRRHRRPQPRRTSSSGRTDHSRRRPDSRRSGYDPRASQTSRQRRPETHRPDQKRRR